MMVWNLTERDFSCEPCQVFVTGFNGNGQLGDGTTINVNGFTNVSTYCFEQIQFRASISLATLGNKTFWAGFENYLYFPSTNEKIKNFQV